jgi:hypothetical protein
MKQQRTTSAGKGVRRLPPFMPDLFVHPLRGVLERLPVEAAETLEEIRIRENRPLGRTDR